MSARVAEIPHQGRKGDLAWFKPLGEIDPVCVVITTVVPEAHAYLGLHHSRGEMFFKHDNITQYARSRRRW